MEGYIMIHSNQPLTKLLAIRILKERLQIIYINKVVKVFISFFSTYLENNLKRLDVCQIDFLIALFNNLFVLRDLSV